jgi:SAM-dependent methyltransferase
MSIQQEFDRIALVTEASEDGAAHNDHYHDYLLQHLPKDCHDVLEIGCGTGTFSRRLATELTASTTNWRGQHDHNAGTAGASPAPVVRLSDRSAGSAGKRGFQRGSPDGVLVLPASGVRILALDFSPEMIRIARARSAQFPNIEFGLADVMERDFESFRGGHRPPASDTGFDCIATIATLHHLPFAEMLAKMKAALRPGGVLLILDLFEPAGMWDSLANLMAIPVSVGLRLIHYGRLLPRREERDAWKAHEQHDRYPTMREVRDVCARLLPGAKIKQHLLWRYSIVWKK